MPSSLAPGLPGGGSTASAAVLRVRDVHKRFGRLEVLRGVDLDLRRGEILALVGENGAGKSTVVRCIARSHPADGGSIELAGQPLASDPLGVRDQGVAVVWQDLALCDNLSVVANLFLGSERLEHLLLDDASMDGAARDLFTRLHLPISELHQPAGALSGGQRQLVAIARAVQGRPPILVLDEPTASLGVTETLLVHRVLADLRDAGTAILLISHRLEQVFGLADRIAVLRNGRITATVSPLEVRPDDVVAMISGIETDSTARRQLRRLRDLVEQLADVEPAASLPLIVSVMVEALGVQQLCVHLLDPAGGDGAGLLHCSASVGLSAAMMTALETLPVDADGGPPGRAAASGEAVVVEDTRDDPGAGRLVAARRGISRSAWSVPIVGTTGVLGTISGFADTAGRPQPDQLELVELYASHAAAAIERERMLAEATRRNRMLETLRGVIDTLAGPQSTEGGLALALLALCRGLGADAIALHHAGGGCSHLTAGPLSPAVTAIARARQHTAASAVLSSVNRLDRARPVGPDVLAVPITAPDGRAVVTAWWSDVTLLTNDALDLLDDAARSLQLALEREALERANAEAASLRRSQRLQRDFLSRLNHELRTPLTAIQGYASTLRQQDVSWDTSSQERFLDSIASESARMARLIGDLLDFSAIDSGTLRLVPDWCDLGLVLEAARRCVSDAPESLVHLADHSDLPPVWGDHDRLEQVFVNLLDNAVRHAPGLTRLTVVARLDPSADTVTVRISDDGVGIPADVAERVFLPHERGMTTAPGAGLGLAIARGIVDAHRGTIRLERVPVGTTVSVTLPVEPAGAEDGGADRQAARAGACERTTTPVTDDATLVLVVEDDPNIVDLVRSNLLVRGFDVLVSRTGADVDELVRDRRPDLVLLDLMLPGVDGFDLCRDIRAGSSIGIIVVSARRGEQDKVRALNLGADDYLTKPFGVDELLARIAALLRRSRVPPDSRPTAPRLTFGRISIDLDARLVTRDGEPVHLTPTEFALLRELATSPGKLLTHAVLLRRVWGAGYETETEYTRVYVRRLRAKLEDPDGPPLIVTEPRAGYRMLPGAESDTADIHNSFMPEA